MLFQNTRASFPNNSLLRVQIFIKRKEDGGYRRWNEFPLLYLFYQLIDGFSFSKKKRQFKVLSNIPVLIILEVQWNAVVWKTYPKSTHPQYVSLTSFAKKSICESLPRSIYFAQFLYICNTINFFSFYWLVVDSGGFSVGERPLVNCIILMGPPLFWREIIFGFGMNSIECWVGLSLQPWGDIWGGLWFSCEMAR